VGDAIHCRKRTVARIDGNKLTVWPTIAAAAREMGVHPSTILRHIRCGRLIDGGEC
jgi:IS30 family transposase